MCVPSGASPGYVVHVISHTHWDREWYRTRQQFRLDLVRTMDTVLQYLREDREFRAFLLDGQAVLVEDYLSLRRDRPRVEEELRRFVRAGRLRIGPWYMQPDEFLVSGESLVRNLEMGLACAASYGGAMRFGWIPDTFGHVAQLPQILNGFGITAAAFTRGVGNHLPEPESEFCWRGEDGSEVLVLHQVQGYFSAGLIAFPYFWGRVAPEHASPARAIARVEPVLEAMRRQTRGRHLILWNGADHMPPEPGISETIRELNRWGAAQPESYRFVHSTVEEAAAAVEEEYRGVTGRDVTGRDVTGRGGAIPPALSVVTGELRGSRYHPLLYGILSARMYLKQRNSHVEQLLERYAEPLEVLSSTVRWEEIRESRRLLVENHGHDSIGGCSIDEVHREMMSRFAQAEEIGRGIALQSLREIAAGAGADGAGGGGAVVDGTGGGGTVVDGAGVSDPEVACLVFSPSDRRGVAVVEHEFRRGGALDAPLVAVDHAGTARPVQILSRELCDYGWLNRDTTVEAVRENLLWWGEVLRRMDALRISSFRIVLRGGSGSAEREGADRTGTPPVLRLFLSDYLVPEGSPGESEILEALRDMPRGPICIQAAFHRYRVAFAADLPPVAAVPFRLVAGAGVTPRPVVAGSASAGVGDGAGASVGNGAGVLRFLGGTVRCNPDGTLTITTGDGTVLGGLNQLEYQDDRGDTYDFSPAGKAELLEPEASPVVELVHEGPVRAAVRVSAEYRRLGQVVTEVSVEEGSPWVTIRMELETTIRDCRLRVRFPLPHVTRSLADAPYAVEERPFVVDDRGWVQPRAATAPHSRWVAAGGDEGALAVSVPGLPEHEVVSGTGVAITVLRCVGWLSRGDLVTREGHAGPMIAVPEAQCPGPASFEYRVRIFPDMDACEQAIPHLSGAHLPPWSVPAAADAVCGASLVDLTGTDFVLTACYRQGEGEGDASGAGGDAGDGAGGDAGGDAGGRAGDGAVDGAVENLTVRFYNCRTAPVTGRIRLHGSITACTMTRLDGTALADLPLSRDHTVEVAARPRHIITLRLRRG